VRLWIASRARCSNSSARCATRPTQSATDCRNERVVDGEEVRPRRGGREYAAPLAADLDRADQLAADPEALDETAQLDRLVGVPDVKAAPGAVRLDREAAVGQREAVEPEFVLLATHRGLAGAERDQALDPRLV
jgi:hypothetical protein